MKALIFSLMSLIFLFSGCTQVSEKEAIEACKKQGKGYIVSEQLNFRTGQLEKYIKCK